MDIGLMKHSLIADALGARLVGIKARDHQNLVLDLFLDDCKPVHVINDGVFAVSGARPDDQNKTGILSFKDRGDFFVAFFFDCFNCRTYRKTPLQFLGRRQFLYIFHLHVYLFISPGVRANGTTAGNGLLE